MEEQRLEDLPKVVEKRRLDSTIEAWILENGSVIIVNAVGGIETILPAEQAYNLLHLLSKHGTRLLHILRPKTLTLDWKKFEAPLIACLQKAYDRFGFESEEPWRVVVMRPVFASVTPGEYTPQGLLTFIAETQDTVNYGRATLFYDEDYKGQRYEGKLVFGSLYLESEQTDQPYALYYRLEEQIPH